MDRSDVIKLIRIDTVREATGVIRKKSTEREVYCQVSSITGSEFFDGGRSGLNPSLRFDLFRYDYEGETEVEYDGARYAIYRTYRTKTDGIELYAERKGGTNGKENKN